MNKLELEQFVKNKMKVRDDLVQGTIQWLEWRRSKVTATDASICMGISPYKTPLQLWKEKMGLVSEKEATEAMIKGKQGEPLALKRCQEELGVELSPCVIEREWMGASLDGYDGNIIVEIKISDKLYEQAQCGYIPDIYKAQMQHQMMTENNVDKVFYYASNGKDDTILVHQRDDKFIHHLMEQEKIFWEQLKNLEMPEPCDRDYLDRTSGEWATYAYEFKKSKQERESWELKEEHYRKMLIKMSQDHNSLGCGVRLTKVVRKGNVDWNSYQKAVGMDSEPYRKKPIETWRLTTYDSATNGLLEEPRRIDAGGDSAS